MAVDSREPASGNAFARNDGECTESPPPQAVSQWGATAQSVQGYSHLANGIPNQDFVDWLPKDEAGPPAMMVVSDGHGGKRYIRSHIGSELAVRVGLAELTRFWEFHKNTEQVRDVGRDAKERLPSLIEKGWREAMSAHFDDNPLADDEIVKLEERGYPGYGSVNEQMKRELYGATFVGVLVTAAWALYVQLGDGDILTVSHLGVTGRPITAVEHVGEETFSLCQEDCRKYVEVRVEPLQRPDPVMIVVSSDGLNKSYTSEENFLKMGKELLDMVRKKGLGAVRDELQKHLAQFSKNGSGDDISVGILKRYEESDVDSVNGRIADQELKTMDLARRLEAALTAPASVESRLRDLAREQQDFEVNLARVVERMDREKAFVRRTVQGWRRSLFLCGVASGVALALCITQLVALGIARTRVSGNKKPEVTNRTSTRAH